MRKGDGSRRVDGSDGGPAEVGPGTDAVQLGGLQKGVEDRVRVGSDVSDGFDHPGSSSSARGLREGCLRLF